MRNVLVTGSEGFIGKNLITELEKRPDILISTFTHAHSEESLKAKVIKSDIIYHLASVMRPSDEKQFQIVNIDLTKKILSYISEAGTTPTFIFTSSTHAELDTLYGKSKLAAEDAIEYYSKDTDNPSIIYRLPNVFGPGAKLDYSVVAIFCSNVANGKKIDIHEPNKVMTLAYVADIVESMISIGLSGPSSETRVLRPTISNLYRITLEELANTISSFKYRKPSKTDPTVNHLLYKTYQSFV